jgi:hypothetical protein
MPKLESQGVVSDPEQDGDITGRLNGGLIRMGMGTPPAKPGGDPDRAALNQ